MMDDPIKKVIANQAFVLLVQQKVLTLSDDEHIGFSATRADESLYIVTHGTEIHRYVITVKEVP